LKQIIIHHRIGFVRVGDASLFLRVTAQRRAAAFGASQWVVDELKRRVPIWKRPKFRIDNQPRKESRLFAQSSLTLSGE
jgi:molybdopterin synthase catalytic subunit